MKVFSCEGLLRRAYLHLNILVTQSFHNTLSDYKVTAYNPRKSDYNVSLLEITEAITETEMALAICTVNAAIR